MNARLDPAPSTLYMADTHTVTNVSHELCDYNSYQQDAALREAVTREGAP